MKKLQALFFIACATMAFISCSDNEANDEKLLWEYYQGFTYPPSLFDSLKQKAHYPYTRDFLQGLRCFEKFDQWDSVSCYDSALLIFSDLIRQHPARYVGYLGKGILLTEKGRKEQARDTNYVVIMDSAEYYYKEALLRAPQHAAIYYYRGRNQFFIREDSVKLNAIAYLDTASQLKKDFFKATERSAEFLSHYYDLAKSNREASERVEANFPNMRERIKYYFEKSLALDSSWYETYEGIAHATQVYSASDRINYLLKGIDIARKKKSKDTTQLSLYLLDIYYHDLKDFEFIKEKLQSNGSSSPQVRGKNAWSVYYLGSSTKKEVYTALTDIQKTDPSFGTWEMYQYYQLTDRFDSARYFLSRVESKDSVEQLVVLLEYAKLNLRQNDKAGAKRYLQQVIARAKTKWGDDASDYEVYNKAYFLRRYLEGYEKK